MSQQDPQATPGDGLEGIMFEIPVELPDPTVLTDEEKAALSTALQKSAETMGIHQVSDVLMMASHTPNEAIRELRRLAQDKVYDAKALERHDAGLEALGEIEEQTRALEQLDELQFKIIRLRDSVDLTAPPTDEVLSMVQLVIPDGDVVCYTTSMEAFEGLASAVKVLAKTSIDNIAKYSGALYDTLLDALGANQTRLTRLQEQIRKADWSEDEKELSFSAKQLSTLTVDGDPGGIEADLKSLLQTLRGGLIKHQADIQRYDGVAYNFVRAVSNATTEDSFARALANIVRVNYPHPSGFNTKREEDWTYYTSPVLPGGRTILMQIRTWDDHAPDTVSNAVRYFETVQNSVDYRMSTAAVDATTNKAKYTKNGLLALCDTAIQLNACYRDLSNGLQAFGNVMKRWQALTDNGLKNLQKQEWLSDGEFSRADKLFDLYTPEVAFYTRLVPRVTVYVDKIITDVIALCSKAV